MAAYQVFIDKFVDAIRYEVARSAERAYESLTIKALGNMLMFQNEQQLKEFISQNDNKDDVSWVERNGRVYFNASKKSQVEIPSNKMINMSLGYATELNRII